MLDLSGVFLPVPTPFRGDDGPPDLEAMERNLSRWLEAPVAGIVVAGSTGEAPLLEDRELYALVDAARELVPRDRLLVAGTGQEATRRTVALCREAAARGADAVMVRPPAYYAEAMDFRALRDHYTATADASPVPVVLYNIPRYVPVELEPELVNALARHPNVAGIKDSDGDIRRLGEVAEGIEGEAALLAGSGSVLYGAMEVGAAGGVVAVGCLAPEETCELAAAVREGDGERAGSLQERLDALNRAVVGRHGVPGVKHALDLLGLSGGPPRPPLRILDRGAQEDVESALRAAGLEAVHAVEADEAGRGRPSDGGTSESEAT